MLPPPEGIVIDGSWLLHKFYHTVAPAFGVDGEPVGVVRAVTRTILKLYNRFEPKYLAFVFDSKEPTFRHILSPDYKAHRPESPEDLNSQMPLIVGLLTAFGFKVVIRPGFEGDDIVGTLAKIMSEEVSPVYVVTGDKDILQIVDEHIRVYDPFKNFIYDPVEVYAKLRVYPPQVADYLALVGDKADGIKGVNGIGPVMAAHLLQSHGNLENIVKSMPDLTPIAQRLLSVGMESLDMDRKLTGMVTDLDLELTIDDLIVTEGDPTEIGRLCDQYNIYSI